MAIYTKEYTLNADASFLVEVRNALVNGSGMSPVTLTVDDGEEKTVTFSGTFWETSSSTEYVSLEALIVQGDNPPQTLVVTGLTLVRRKTTPIPTTPISVVGHISSTKPEPKWGAAGGVLFLRCVSGGTVTQAGLRIPFDKTAAKILSVLNVSGDTYNDGSLTPIFVDIPVVTSLTLLGYSYVNGENIVLISNYKAFLDSTLDIYTDNNFRYFITYDMENNTPSAFYLTIATRE